jgi:hypothetical protein
MVVFQILAGLFWFDAKYCLPIADVFAGFTAAHELKFIFTTAKLQNHYLVRSVISDTKSMNHHINKG